MSDPLQTLRVCARTLALRGGEDQFVAALHWAIAQLEARAREATTPPVSEKQVAAVQAYCREWSADYPVLSAVLDEIEAVAQREQAHVPAAGERETPTSFHDARRRAADAGDDVE